jgi:hypothetical protein
MFIAERLIDIKIPLAARDIFAFETHAWST